MTENTAAPETTAPAAAPKKAVKKAPKKAAPAKKAPAKKAAKKVAKKPAKKAPANKGTKTVARAKKDGLRKPQLRVLTALAKAPRSLSRAEISAKGKVDLASLNEVIGAHDEKVRKINDTKWFMSLLTLGFVAYAASEGDAPHYYKITAAGKKALANAEKA